MIFLCYNGVGDFMGQQGLNSFYYDLLNIKKKSNELETIKETIKENTRELLTTASSLERFCKVIANNISLDLFNQNIPNCIINTKELFGCYEHEFVIAYYKESDSIKYLLIDPSYNQFVARQEKLKSFNEWPANILRESIKGQKICEALLTEGFCFVDEMGIKEYLNSFLNICDFNTIPFNLEDIIVDKVGKRI